MSSSRMPPRACLTRRAAVLAAVSSVLAACQQTVSRRVVPAAPSPREPLPDSPYQPLPNERFPIPAVRAGDVDARYLRQRVRYATPHRPGTVVVEPDAKFLY